MAAAEEFPGIGDRSGFGARPALIVVDMSLAFTSPESPLGSDLDATVAAIEPLLAAARANDVPVVYTTVAYGERERVTARAMLRKWPAASVCEPGSRWVEIDERLAPAEEDEVITKVFPSAFFGTYLDTRLRSLGCDSVLITGASTSGCVRATAVDAVSHGFVVVVPRDAVGDRLADAHERNLIDIDLKYGDVVVLEEALAWLRQVRPDQTSATAPR